MKKIITLIILFFFGQLAFAQLPWNAKVMLHNPNTGEMDTVWIGCDENGAIGFQEGLDIIDTLLVNNLGIWSDDTIVNSDCFNLKKDIRDFITGNKYFDLQLIDSNIGFVPDYIKIDSNEFKFDDGINTITFAYVKVLEGGYVMAPDVETWGIFYGADTINFPNNPFYTDSISIFYESSNNSCISNEISNMRLQLIVGVNTYVPTGYPLLRVEKLMIFPNPSGGELFIEHAQEYKFFELFSQYGERITEGNLSGSDTFYKINLQEVHQGYYILRLFNEFGFLSTIKSLIIM